MRVFKSKYSGRNSSSSSALHLSVQNDCAPYALEMRPACVHLLQHFIPHHSYNGTLKHAFRQPGMCMR
eukprot:scaffold65242_cov20-Tisochrysis_lutea.AAC.3